MELETRIDKSIRKSYERTESLEEMIAETKKAQTKTAHEQAKARMEREPRTTCGFVSGTKQLSYLRTEWHKS